MSILKCIVFFTQQNTDASFPQNHPCYKNKVLSNGCVTKRQLPWKLYNKKRNRNDLEGVLSGMVEGHGIVLGLHRVNGREPIVESNPSVA